MDATEKHVHAHLLARGLGDVVVEPEPNDPPDFLVGGRIAVEATRLNQRWERSAGRPRGLEEDEIPLRAKVERLLRELGPPTDGVTWFVMYDFRRPLVPWRDQLAPLLREALEGFRRSPTPDSVLKVAPRFRLHLIKATVAQRCHFQLGGYTDHDSGGFVLGEMITSLRLCVGEKTVKVARVRSRYPEWWLVFVDRVGHGLSPEHAEELRRLLPRDKAWDRIIVVSPTDASRFFELI